MGRPKIHGDRVEWKLRLPLDLAAAVERAAVEGKTDRNTIICRQLGHLLLAQQGVDACWTGVSGSAFEGPGTIHTDGPPKQTPVTPDTSTQKPITGDKNCPHKYRVRRGNQSVCAACGDVR